MVMLIILSLFVVFTTTNGCSSLCCNITTDKSEYKRNDTIYVSFNCVYTSGRLLYDVNPKPALGASIDYYVRIVPAHMEYNPDILGNWISRENFSYGMSKEFGANASFFVNERYKNGQYKVFLSDYQWDNTRSLVCISELFEIMGQRTTFLGRIWDREVSSWKWLLSLFGK